VSVQRFTFGPFELDAMRLELRRDGVRLNVGARACRLLVALVQRRGQVVTQRELMAAGWSGLHVADVNLRVHIVALRKALSDGPDGSFDITTVPREGYVFAGPEAPTDTTDPTKAPPAAPRMVPRHLTTLFGREETLPRLADAVAAHRIVTITGPGGVGKTAMALTAIGEHEDQNTECVFVDFSTSVSSLQVEARLFEALELEGSPNDVPTYIERALRGRTILLVLDNCEHVVAHVAAMVAGLTSRTEGVSILATSREPLRVPGERVFPLEPLSCPPEGAVLTTKSAMSFAAIQMFAEAASRRTLTFSVDDANASMLGEICRRLDGSPLAIELAAATSDTMTVSELARRLDDRFAILTRGARTALPKHRTLQAALDWSYDALNEEEAVVMRRLGVFPGRFGTEDAKAIIADGTAHPDAIHHVLANLTAKSLLTVDFSSDTASFRFLETMRVYARLKLLESEEAVSIYARFVDHTLVRMTAINQQDPQEDFSRTHGAIVDDWRAAHDWAIRRRDWRLALRLMAEGIGFCRSLNVRMEYLHRAIETLRMKPADHQVDDDLWLEMRVCGHTAQMLLDTQPPDPPNFLNMVKEYASRSLELSERLNAPDYQMSALTTLTIGALTGADVEQLEVHASSVLDLARSRKDPESIRTAHYLNAYASYYRSDFAAAERECDRSLDLAAQAEPAASIAFDHLPSVRVLRSRTLWIRGEFAAALDEMEEAHRIAIDGGHVPTIAWVAWCGMCVYLWAGIPEKAADSAKLHEQLANEYRNPGWSRYVPSAHDALERFRHGGRSFGSAAIDWVPHVSSHADMMTSIHCCFHRPVDLHRIELAPRHWCASEHVRAAGEHHLFAGRTAEAEKSFLRALSISQSHAAAAWEIRASISLARLVLQQGRDAAARALLEPLAERFSMVTHNADLDYAKGLLNTC
jgi:predicted ATPase/DNA-binding winged helix-turn-helix (wHTH) protein